MSNRSIIFIALKYVVLVMLLFIVVGSLLGLENYNMSLSRLLDGFSNSPTMDASKDINNTLNNFKSTISDLTIEKTGESMALDTLIGFVNAISNGFFGMLSLSITLVQMLGNVVTFASYCWTTFLL